MHLPFIYNFNNCTNHISIDGKKRTLIQVRRRNGLSDFPPINLIDTVKKQNYSYSVITKITKPSALYSTNKNLNRMSIKTLGNYIKQKILDISMKLEKDEVNFSEIENCNNSNMTIPFMSMNKIIKKLSSESGYESLSYLHNKKEEKRKITNRPSFKKNQ